MLYLHKFIVPFEEKCPAFGIWLFGRSRFLKATLNYCCFDCFASRACGRGAPHNRMSECRQSGPVLEITKTQCCCFSSDLCVPELFRIFWRICLFFLLSICHPFRRLHIQLYRWLKHFTVGLHWNRNISPFTWVGPSAFRRLLWK